MSSTVTKFFKIVQPRNDLIALPDGQGDALSGGLYGGTGWYHKTVQGAPTRMQRYRDYEQMDADVDVSRALDLTAAEIAGNVGKNELPLEINIIAETGETIHSSVVVTLKSALKTWCAIQDWNRRLYPTIRGTIKYGDYFYIKPKKRFQKMMAVHPKNVPDAIVDRVDITNVKGWYIRTDFNNISNDGNDATLSFTSNTTAGSINIATFPANEVVRFSLTEDLTEGAPFGKSILQDIYKTFKQKELLEDSILIYRIQRAPERRVFYIDTGGMHPNKIATHLEQVKNEFRQKKVPVVQNGQNHVESVYNPQTQTEEFFFAKRKDGSGTTVENLPSGQNLGELADLEYFYNRMWRGLNIPKSYIDPNNESSYSDGKVGIAYQQEILFIMYIERLQKTFEDVLDKEFKLFLHEQGIKVDNTIFRVVLPAPTNFAKSRNQQMDAEVINNYTAVVDVKVLSERFKLSRYLQLSEEEIILNERQKLQESGINPDTAKTSDLVRIYNPDLAEAGGMDGGMPSGDAAMDAPLYPNDEEGGDDEDADDAGGDDIQADGLDADGNAPKK